MAQETDDAPPINVHGGEKLYDLHSQEQHKAAPKGKQNDDAPVKHGSGGQPHEAHKGTTYPSLHPMTEAQTKKVEEQIKKALHLATDIKPVEGAVDIPIRPPATPQQPKPSSRHLE